MVLIPGRLGAVGFFMATWVMTFTYICGCIPAEFLHKKPAGNPWKCSQEADQALQDGDYATGIRLHHLLLERNPANAEALYHLGYGYGMLGNHNTEIYYYEKAIALGYKYNDIFFNLGMAYGEMNRLKEAAGALEKALALDPGNDEARRMLIDIYEVSGKPHKADRLKNPD